MAATATKLGDRRDARRNRVRIVAAAREVFSSAGADAPARKIARRADVGVATLYRHFPARADLVDAVLEEAFEELIQIAEAALAEPDPWTGFVRTATSPMCRGPAMTHNGHAPWA
jgi:AcrR family transcriptional regulator